MKIKFADNVLKVTTDIPAKDLPIAIKDEEGNDVFAFSKGAFPKLTSYNFQGNTAIKGKLAIVEVKDEGFDLEDYVKANRVALYNAKINEDKAKELAAAVEAKATEMDAAIADMLI